MDLHAGRDRARLFHLLGAVDPTSSKLLNNVFALGVNEPHKTFLSQQRRALNLVEALVLDGRLTSHSAVTVVGGGAAGLTAASAAAVRGGRVTLLEERNRVLAVQAGSHSRWLHPHVINWPAAGWHHPDADLPLLTWSAGHASDVAAELTLKWRALAGAFEIREVVSAANVDVAPGDAIHTVTWNAPGGFGTTSADIVIFATGFGYEGRRPGHHSYWREDHLDDADRDNASTLVSGCGDGGLIDFFRAAVAYGSWPAVYDVLARASDDVAAAVAAAESNCTTDQALSQFYIDLELPELDDWVRQYRRPAQVWLNSPSSMPFRRQGAAPINKLLASRVLRTGGQYIAGTAEYVGRDGISGTRAIIAGLERTFDFVIMRHGPAVDPLSAFPAVAPAATDAELLKFADFLDISREPMWDHEAMKWPKGEGPPPTVPVHGPRPKPWTDPFTASQDDTSEDALLHFLGGGDPPWSLITRFLLPERDQVVDLAKSVFDQTRGGGRSAITLITGAAGDGKSTIIKQVAAHLKGLDPELHVLWREEGRHLPLTQIRRMDPDEPVVCLADDVQDLLPHLASVVSRTAFDRDIVNRPAPVHFIFAVNLTLIDEWPSLIRRISRKMEVRERTASTLSKSDASKIVGALEAASLVDPSALGLLSELPSHSDRVRRLMRAAASNSDSSLLGALLECRTGQTLEQHVLNLFDQLQLQRIPSGYSLEEVYCFVGLLQFVGLGSIDRTLLAEALDIDLNELGRSLRPLLRAEIIEERGRLRLRHGAIAAAAWDIVLSDERRREMVTYIVEELVAASTRLYPDGWRDAWMHDVQYLALKLKGKHSDLARAAARGAVAGAPRNLFFITTLASVLRETSHGREGAAEGAALLARAFADANGDGRTPPDNIRHLLTEWATCVGFSGTSVSHAVGNFVLAILAVADDPLDGRKAIGEPTRALSAAGRALLDLNRRWDSDIARKALAATVTILERHHDRDGAQRFLRRFEREVEGCVRPGLNEAIVTLEDVCEVVWPLLAPDVQDLIVRWAPRPSLSQLGGVSGTSVAD